MHVMRKYNAKPQRICIFFDFNFVFFFSIRFRSTVRFVHSEQKENIQVIREFLNDKLIRHREVYSIRHLRGERQPIKLLCFRKTNT